MDINYKDIELSASQKSCLKKFKRKTIRTSEIEDSNLKFFVKYGLVKCINSGSRFLNGNQTESIYAITDVGRMLLKFKGKDMRRTWYPFIVSTLAFILSVIALFKAW